MRFSALVAFILPLSALAAPSLVKRGLEPIDTKRSDLTKILNAVDSSLDDIINFGRIPIPPKEIKALLTKAGNAKGAIDRAIESEKSIIDTGKTVKDSEAVVTRGIFKASSIMDDLKNKFTAGADGFVPTDAQRGSLTTSIENAISQIKSAKGSQGDILNDEKLDLGELLQVRVPGFDSLI